MTGPAQPIEAHLSDRPKDVGAKFPRLIEGQGHRADRQSLLTADVGQMDSAELDAYISMLGKHMVRAHRLGDRDAALRLMELQQEARAARSPAHVARQDAEHLARVEAGVGFFSSEHAQRMGRAGARA